MAAKKKSSSKKNEYGSAPRKGETEVGKNRTDRIIQKRTFEYYNKPTVGAEFYIFRKVNDQITGQIIGHAITNVRRNSSYPIKLEDGRVVEIFANKQLHGIIRDYELVMSHVRIVYIGRNHNGWGHAAKIYRVYKIKHGVKSGPLVQHLKSLKSKRKVKK